MLIAYVDSLHVKRNKVVEGSYLDIVDTRVSIPLLQPILLCNFIIAH